MIFLSQLHSWCYCQGIVEQDILSGTHQLREGVEIDTKNWDEPLIIADPDIQVNRRPPLSFWEFSHTE